MEKSNKAVRAVPEGFHTVSPYLVVENATRFMEFIEKAFNGKITYVKKQDDEKVMHATVQIGDSLIMICDAMEMAPAQPAILYLYVEDADQLFKKAKQAKATVISEMENQFYGDRVGAVKDEWGNVWWIGTHVEDVEEEELEKSEDRFEGAKGKSTGNARLTRSEAWQLSARLFYCGQNKSLPRETVRSNSARNGRRQNGLKQLD